MMRRKKILLFLATVILVWPSFLVNAATVDRPSKKEIVQGDGEISAKDEVVYATLDATGNRQEMYVVNILDIVKAGTITDHGTYSSLKNLTDLSSIEQIGDTVKFTASKGKFYYQGNINDASLPWDIVVSYFLDGEEIAPEELAGKDGHVQIRIKTSYNKKVNDVFIENYLLQISLTLNSDRYSNIEVEDGMIANVGKNKQVTFTVMPEQEKELVLEAHVVGFELDGINFTGVPSSIPIDAPNMDEMSGDIKLLSNAIAEINHGVGELKDGVSQLNDGVGKLLDGSKQYKHGIADLDQSSGELVNGSNDIKSALDTLNKSLNDINGIDLTGIEELENRLHQLSNGLREVAEGLNLLKTNYRAAYDALDQKMKAIPTYDVSKEEIQSLYESAENQKVVDQLVETYTAAQTAKGTYSQVRPSFDAVVPTLESVSGSLTKMANQLDLMKNEFSSSLEGNNGIGGLTKLQEGIATLSSNYKDFHSGLVEYTGGVSQLSDSYIELHNGMIELSDGTNELESGLEELHAGTTRLQKSTSHLPEQMTKEIDQIISEYDHSDFEVESFVSSKNKKINLVQFIFKTESIQSEELEKTKEPVKKEKGFWSLLIDLFK